MSDSRSLKSSVADLGEGPGGPPPPLFWVKKEEMTEQIDTLAEPVLTYVCFVSVFSRTDVSRWNCNEKGLKDGTQSV